MQTKSMAEIINNLPEDEREAYYATLTEEDWEALEYDAEFWLRPSQKIPTTGDWYITALVSGRGFGKQECVETPIPTPNGWKRLGDIVAGDLVFDEYGKPCTVVQAHPITTPERAYKIKFSGGGESICNPEHLWTTWTHSDRKSYNRRNEYIESDDSTGLPEDWTTWTKKTRWGHQTGVGPKTRTTQEIADTFTYGKRGDLNHSIPVLASPLQYSKKDLPVDPYAYGTWLGDGSTAGGEISSHKNDTPWLRTIMESRGYAPRDSRRHIDYRTNERTNTDLTTFIGLYKSLRESGVLGNKNILDIYRYGSIQQRKDVLAGLLDTDGFVDKTSQYIEFCSMREDHAEFVKELAMSLGQKPRIYTGDATLNGVSYGTKFRVQWRPTENFFYMPRKAEVFKPLGGQASRTMHRMMISIEEVDPTPMRCLSVDSASHLFLRGKEMIPTHNTRTMAEWCRKFVRENPGCRIAIGGRTSADIRNTMVTGDSGILAVSPPDERPVYKMHTSSLEWPNGSTALLLSSESPDGARGPQFHAALLDEFAAWKTTPDASGATLYDNIVAATRLGEHPKILMATTPKKTIVMRNLIEQAKDPKRNTKIIRGSTLENSSLSAAYIENLKLQYGDSDLAQQEIYGQMLEDAQGVVFTTEMLDKAEDCGIVPKNLLKIIAVDPSVARDAKNRDDCGIMIVGCTREADPRRRTAYILSDETINASPDVWSKKVADLARDWGIKHVVAESNQGGDLITKAIVTENPALKVHLVHATKGKVKRVEPIVIAMQQGRVKLAGEFLELKDQLMFYDPDLAGYSPDRMDAFAWGCTALLVSQPKGLVFGTLRTDRAASKALPAGRMTSLNRMKSRRTIRR